MGRSSGSAIALCVRVVSVSEIDFLIFFTCLFFAFGLGFCYGNYWHFSLLFWSRAHRRHLNSTAFLQCCTFSVLLPEIGCWIFLQEVFQCDIAFEQRDCTLYIIVFNYLRSWKPILSVGFDAAILFAFWNWRYYLWIFNCCWGKLFYSYCLKAKESLSLGILEQVSFEWNYFNG